MLIVAILLVVCPTNRIVADDIEFSYDIFSRDGRLTVWLDLAAFMSSRAGEQLKDGIDLAIQYELTLKTPRRFFGDREIAQVTRIPVVRYRSLTDDYLLDNLLEGEESPAEFVSMAGLFQYLRDSIETELTLLDSLDSSERYVLHFKVTTISLTDINLSPRSPDQDNSESPIHYLFRQFLDVTGYGRREYDAKSRVFAVSELDVIE